jgi:site-specific DNA recombinase
MLSLGGLAEEDHRHRSQQKGREKRRAQIEKGHWPGGKCYGYAKRDVYTTAADGRQVRSHVLLEVLEEEAQVVRDIYEMYARGHGYRTIAHELNRRGLPAPRAQRGRPSEWDSGTIYAVLRRPLYRCTAVRWSTGSARSAMLMGGAS